LYVVDVLVLVTIQQAVVASRTASHISYRCSRLKVSVVNDNGSWDLASTNYVQRNAMPGFYTALANDM